MVRGQTNVMVKETETAQLSCPDPNSPIVLTIARWNINTGDHRRDCSADVLGRVAKACNGKTTCSIVASVDVLGADPCPGRVKTLDINYRCSPEGKIVNSGTPGAFTSTTVEPNSDTFSCRNNGFIAIRTADWGIKNNPSCSFPVISLMMSKCPLFRSCYVEATNAFLGGDPCPGQQKTLSITYDCIFPSIRTY